MMSAGPHSSASVWRIPVPPAGMMSSGRLVAGPSGEKVIA